MRYKHGLTCWSFSLALLLIAPAAAQQNDAPLRLANPFFAFDNGTGRGSLPADQQAAMLADLGYAGIGYTGGEKIPEMLGALDAHQLKMFSTYVGCYVGKKGISYDPQLPAAIQALKGRDTLIWLTVQGQAEDDQQAVEVVQQVADLADKAGLRVALYPHVGFFVETTEDALRIATKVKRKNVGVSFNLCHCLMQGNEAAIPEILKKAMPHLLVVSINGADHEGNWDRLIQTLDRGEYDVFALLVLLKKLGYEGPIGLQCYNVPGEPRENLQRSIGAWKKFMARTLRP